MHSVDIRGGAKARLEDFGRGVMARADAGREDQDASTHEVMLGQPVTKVSAQFHHSRTRSAFEFDTDIPENRPGLAPAHPLSHPPVLGQCGG